MNFVITAYRNLAVERKLRVIVMGTTGLALILASAAILVYDQIAARVMMSNDIGVLSQIFSANSTAALSFDDRAAGEELLSTLRVKTHITDAFLLSADGRVFAAYHRAGIRTPAAPPAIFPDARRWF